MSTSDGQFTVLVILTEIGEGRVVPLCSTYMHVIGDEIDWEGITVMLAGSGQHWDGTAFFPTKARKGGPIDNPTAAAVIDGIAVGLAEALDREPVRACARDDEVALCTAFMP